MVDYHAVTEAMRIAYEQTRLLREVTARRNAPQDAPGRPPGVPRTTTHPDDENPSLIAYEHESVGV